MKDVNQVSSCQHVVAIGVSAFVCHHCWNWTEHNVVVFSLVSIVAFTFIRALYFVRVMYMGIYNITQHSTAPYNIT